MRKIALCLALAFLLSVPVSASGLSTREQALYDALPPDAGSLLDTPSQSTSFGEGLRTILQNILPSFEAAIHDALRSVGIMLAALVLCAMAGGTDGMSPAVLAGVLAISSAGMLEVHALTRSGLEALEEMGSFADLLLPSMAAATAATGGVTASTAIYAGTALFTDVLMHLMRTLLLPFLYAYVAMRAAQAVCGNELLSRIAGLLKGGFQTGLKTILFVFTAYLTITGLLAGSADATAIKAAKLTLSGVVPVVGSMISDASETVIVGAAAVKNAVGIFGMLAVIAICIGPFLRIAAQYLLLKLASAAGGALGTKPLLSLMDAIGEAMGFLLAMTGTSALMLLISCVCYLKVTPV